MAELLRTGEVSRILGVSVNTVYEWIEKGKLAPAQRTPLGMLFDPAEIERLRAERAAAAEASA